MARDNNVHNESKCIFISQSHDNEIYNNKVDNCNNGIYLFNKSFANSVHHNTMGLFNESSSQVRSDSSENHIYSNQIAVKSVT